MRNTPESYISDAMLLRLDRFASKIGLRVTRSGFDLRHVPVLHRKIAAQVMSFTATEALTIVALLDALGYLEKNHVPGSIVECGVYRGGSMMAAALGLMAEGNTERELWLYDTFEGMPQPSAEDIRARDGKMVTELFDVRKAGLPSDGEGWMLAGLAEVGSVPSSGVFR